MLAAITAAYAGFVGCGSPGTRRPAAPEATPATRPAAGAAAASAPGDGADDGVFATVRDWPQWRGLNRDATSPERITIWPPRQLWQREVGNGVSSVIACRGRVFVLGREGGQDAVYCLDAAGGEVLWKHLYASKDDHTSDVKLPGPRSTPATDGLRLYTLILEDPAPEGYRELGREDLLTGRYWSVPALTRGRLFCRSNTGRVTAFRVGQAENG